MNSFFKKIRSPILFFVILILASPKLLAAPNQFTELRNVKGLIQKYYEDRQQEIIKGHQIFLADYNEDEASLVEFSSYKHSKYLKGEQYEKVARAYNALEKQIISWVYLWNASENNRLISYNFSSKIKENISCQKRIIFELLEEKLKVLDSEQQVLLLNLIYNTKNFPSVPMSGDEDYLKWVQLDSKYSFGFPSSLNKPIHYIVEWSQLIRDSIGKYNGYVLKKYSFYEIINNNEQLKKDTIDGDKIKQFLEAYQKSNREIDQALECKQEIDLGTVSPWFDLQEIVQLGYQNQNLKDNLKNFFLTSEMVDMPNYSDKELALNPDLGVKLNLDHYKELLDVYWKLIPELAYSTQKIKGKRSKQYINNESCQRILKPLFMGILLGIKVDSSEIIQKLKISSEDYAEWVALRIALELIETASHSGKYCAIATSWLERVWPDLGEDIFHNYGMEFTSSDVADWIPSKAKLEFSNAAFPGLEFSLDVDRDNYQSKKGWGNLVKPEVDID